MPNEPVRPDKVVPIGRKLEEPKKTALSGPKVIRVEQPESLPAPRPRGLACGRTNDRCLTRSVRRVLPAGIPLVYELDKDLKPIRTERTSEDSALSGFFPLVVASGAGAMSQRSIGSVIFGGLLVATVMSLFVVPSFYVLMKKLEANWFPASHESPQPLPEG